MTGRQKVDNPLFNFTYFYVETWGDDSTLIYASNKLNNDLVGTVVVNNFKFSNVAFRKNE